jgi:hypothetical protein
MRVLGEFERHGDVIERRFTKSERRMIANLAATTASALEEVDGTATLQDPVLARLLPAAYADDPEAAEEFADATRERLAEGKVEGLRRLPADLEAAPGGVLRLGPDDAVVWLKALGDLRLALAERVGIDEVQRGVHTPQGMLYAWLTWLQGSLIDAVDA